MVVSFGVIFRLVCVSGAVDFDDHPDFGAEEIDDVWADRMLAAETPPAHLPSA